MYINYVLNELCLNFLKIIYFFYHLCLSVHTRMRVPWELRPCLYYKWLQPNAHRTLPGKVSTQQILGEWTECGLSQWLSDKESACNAEDTGLIPGLGRSPGGGHGNRLQYSCLENPMARGAWWATVHRLTKSRTQLKRLSTHHKLNALSS